MKASINKDGCLTIQAENELEVYALATWIRDNPTTRFNFSNLGWVNTSKLIIKAYQDDEEN